MKHFKLVLLAAILILPFAACKKNKCTVEGRVTYYGSGMMPMPATGATVGLYLNASLTNAAYSCTVDVNGNYSMYPVDHGTYFLYAELSEAGVTYTYTSSILVPKYSTVGEEFSLN